MENARYKSLISIPEQVVETTGITIDGGIIGMDDGSFMLMQGNYKRSSSDGINWSENSIINSEVHCDNVVRTAIGTLIIVGRSKKDYKSLEGQFGEHALDNFKYLCAKSYDNGETWTEAKSVVTYPGLAFYSFGNRLIQLKSGRLLLSGYWEGMNCNTYDNDRHQRSGWGYWKKKIMFMEGHRSAEMGICISYYSDDEGDTWKRSTGGIFGIFDRHGEPNGYDGIIDLYEPTSAETKDSRVIMICRSKTGRLVHVYSDDEGENWNSAYPMELSSSQSPATLVSLPVSGDLLCIWNQVSSEEIRRGFLRGRLSSAISKDSGLTWVNFKTIELQEGMENSVKIAPDYPIERRVVGRSGLNKLPDGFMMFTYPDALCANNKVFLRYSRMWPAMRKDLERKRDPSLPVMWPDYNEREADMQGEAVFRVYPVEWFYE